MSQITETQKKHLETIPTSKRNIIDRAYSGKSKATALKAKCLDCVGYEDATTRIRECACEICPLWAYRPYQVKETK